MADYKSSYSSQRVKVTEDGAVRYYWLEWVPALFWAILGLGLLPTLVFFLLPPLHLLLYFLLPGLGVLYFAIGKAINYTEFRVEGGNLFVRHKPLPWRGNISIPQMEIGEINVKMKTDMIHHDDIGSTVSYRVNYQVVAVHLADGHKIPLISGLRLDTADEIAREVGNALEKSAQPPHLL